MDSFGTLTTIVTIVSVIFGILNIVLFFKLWGMTDDVKRMLNIMEKSYYGEKEERYEINEDEETSDRKMNSTFLIIVIVIIVGLILLATI